MTESTCANGSLRLSASPQPGHAAGFAAGVEAAAQILQGWLDRYSSKEIAYTSPREYASDAILDCADAIRALPLPEEPSVEASPAVSVKPLEWVDTGQRGFLQCHHYAVSGSLRHTVHPVDTEDGGFYEHYGIEYRTDDPLPWKLAYWVGNNGLSGVNKSFATIEAAKAAAQADYDQRILSAIVTAPAPALDREKVARLSDEAWTSIESYLNDECNLGSCGDIDDSARSNCSNVIANAIIALIEGGKSS